MFSAYLVDLVWSVQCVQNIFFLFCIVFIFFWRVVGFIHFINKFFLSTIVLLTYLEKTFISLARIFFIIVSAVRIRFRGFGQFMLKWPISIQSWQPGLLFSCMQALPCVFFFSDLGFIYWLSPVNISCISSTRLFFLQLCFLSWP